MQHCFHITPNLLEERQQTYVFQSICYNFQSLVLSNIALSIFCRFHRLVFPMPEFAIWRQWGKSRLSEIKKGDTVMYQADNKYLAEWLNPVPPKNIGSFGLLLIILNYFRAERGCGIFDWESCMIYWAET